MNEQSHIMYTPTATKYVAGVINKNLGKDDVIGGIYKSLDYAANLIIRAKKVGDDSIYTKEQIEKAEQILISIPRGKEYFEEIIRTAKANV